VEHFPAPANELRADDQEVGACADFSIPAGFADGYRNMVKSVVDGTLTWLLGDHLGSTSMTAQADGTTPTDYQ
jgi:hypothetical protein